jgi:spindle assembly abnormal protein 6
METEPIQLVFDQELAVKFKFTDKDERKPLRTHLSIGWVTKLTQRNKVLSVQLTEDTDLFFLYTLEMSEEEFYQLKQEQGLLVDFSSFPMKFIELLNMCIACEKEIHPK